MKCEFYTPGWLLMVEFELQRILDEGPPWMRAFNFRLIEAYRCAPPLRSPADRTVWLDLEIVDGVGRVSSQPGERFDLKLEFLWDDACRSARMTRHSDYDAFWAWRMANGRLKVAGRGEDALPILRRLQQAVADRTL